MLEGRGPHLCAGLVPFSAIAVNHLPSGGILPRASIRDLSTHQPWERGGMWLWEVEMHELGLRRRGERFRVCEGRFGLEGHDHITVFSWGEQMLPDGRILAELAE